ncbi:MAG: hypothetical protein WDO69_18485 [Pseudomonadota bacterium]
MISILMAAAISGIVSGAPAPSDSLASNLTDRTSDAQQLDDSKGGKHACKGQNACKGQGGCKTEKHACKGQNACKGQGGCKG